MSTSKLVREIYNAMTNKKIKIERYVVRKRIAKINVKNNERNAMTQMKNDFQKQEVFSLCRIDIR